MRPLGIVLLLMACGSGSHENPNLADASSEADASLRDASTTDSIGTTDAHTPADGSTSVDAGGTDATPDPEPVSTTELVFSAGAASPVGDLALRLGLDGEPRIGFLDFNPFDTGVRFARRGPTGWSVTPVYETNQTLFVQALDMEIGVDGSEHMLWGDCAYSSRLPEQSWSHAFDVPCRASGSRSRGFAVGDDGGLHLAYEGPAQAYPAYARSEDTGWAVQSTHAQRGPQGIAMAINSLGAPRLVFADNDAFYEPNIGLTYQEFDGTMWTSEIVDATAGEAQRIALALDENDSPHICYSGAGKYAHRTTAGAWIIEDLPGVNSSRDCEIILDDSGTPHVCSITGGGLRYHTRVNGEWKLIASSAHGQAYCSIQVGEGETHIAFDQSSPRGIRYMLVK